MKALLAAALAGCAPAIVWSGGSADRRLRAEVRSARGEQWVRVAGSDGPRFEAIATGGITFSADGRRFAYPAQRHGRWLMVVDGTPAGDWDGVAEPAFSADGSRIAWLAESGGRWRPVVDGIDGKGYEAIAAGSLCFSGDGRHVGFVALTGSCAAIVVDGVEGGCHEAVAGLRLVAGGAAAVVRDGGRVHLLRGSATGPGWDAIGDWLVTPDGAREAYAALANGRWYPVIDGAAGPAADAVRQWRFGDGGRRVAFVAVEGSSARVVIDGVKGPGFAAIRHLALADRAPTFAYSAEDERGAWVVIDGERQGRFAAVLDLALSSDGRRAAFVARRSGHTFVVHDGREVPLDAVIEGTLVLSPDGEHWAVVQADAEKRRFQVSIDGRPAAPVAADDVLVGPDLRPFVSRELDEAFAAAGSMR
ncbi:MAG TPA: hypothetical protein VLW85_14885 [Myxococcales bacterium]|nr:hypothetical protein [Myxococcales bacterium]